MPKPILLVKSGGEAAMPEWQRHFAEFAPDLEVRWWDDPAVAPEDVAYLLLWDPEPGRIAGYRNLQVIFGTGAGVDFIVADPALPKHLPLVRMATPNATQRMGEFVGWAVLSLLKGARRIGLNQAARRWEYIEPEFAAPELTVGVMGLGRMGTRSAEILFGIGFNVIGWSKTRKDLPGIESFAGEAERDAFLARCDHLVCLLPATPETRGILAAPLFARLKPGAGLVNVGRGSHQSIEDILAALDSGQLCGAVIDVFEKEPLPPEHPAWAHEKLLLTPHLASLPSRRDRARAVADNIARHQRGETLPNLYDHARGY